MGEIVRMDNGKDNEIMAIMKDASLCPLLEETKVGVSNYTKLPVTRLAALGTAFQPLTTAVQTAVTGAGGSGLYYVNTAGKTMFQMKETDNFIGSLKTSAGLVGGGQAQMMPLAFDPTMLLWRLHLRILIKTGFYKRNAAGNDGFSCSEGKGRIKRKSYISV